MTENSKIAISAAAIGCAIAVFASPTFAVAAPLSAHIELGDHGFGFKSIGFRASSVRLTITNQGRKTACPCRQQIRLEPVCNRGDQDLVAGTDVASRAVDTAG